MPQVTGTRFRSNSRVLRTGSPLTLENLRHHAPAVFANEPHESRGPRYRYVPTIEPLSKLLENGWGVYEATQQRSRDSNRDPYTKHMLRLRKLENFSPNQVSRDGVPELLIVNAHDGTAAYRLYSGYFRFICSNGLVAGTNITSFVVYHTVGPKTAQEVLEAGERVVLESAPRMLEQIDKYRGIEVPKEQQMMLAQTALNLRYGTKLPLFTPEEVLQIRREEDAANNLWTVLNRIQENIIYGGWEVRSFSGNRRSEVRPVERVTNVVKINTGLWDAAESLAKELA